ncbi:1-phosphofructokinase [Mesobacillus maritimus]|uniref:1-phosphofructokinase n=1 Tax=Mesobacillus maritimus TaxID=1643336 RepID=UPI00203EF0A2|nr:1-phosphofructokinase [Mesobacillus maritimus]MCM3588065.1 1-phosphofructokinase [Mesobacillus maritimus]
MIYTLTLNPSVDYILGLDEVNLGKLNRTKTEAKFPGGKGINVSRVLCSLGVPNTATGFIGGFTGTYVKDYLTHEGIEAAFVNVSQDTRINVKLKADEETEINARGPEISEKNVQMLKEQIKNLTKEDLLVLAGSIPSTLPESIYEEVVHICNERGVEFVVDAEGDILKRVLPYHPFLIKPNHHELGQFFNKEIQTCEEAIIYAKKLIELGAKNVIVSLAEKGAVFINKEKALTASVPVGQLMSSVGAGDSMVAAFLAKSTVTGNLEDAFRYSVAAGSATAFSIGLGSPQKIEELLPQVQLKQS